MEFSNLKIADWKCGDSSETWGGNGNQDRTRSCVSWKNKPSVWRDVGAAAISSDIIYRSGKDGFPQGNIICKLKKNEYKKWDWFFFLNSRFFSSYFTVLSCSNLMLMSLSLGLSTLVFLATLGTLKLLRLQAAAWSDVVPHPWSIGIAWVPHLILWFILCSVPVQFPFTPCSLRDILLSPFLLPGYLQGPALKSPSSWNGLPLDGGGNCSPWTAEI